MSRILRANHNLMLREIAGEHLLIPVGEIAMDVHGMISLSESGLLLWKKLQQGCTETELIEAILSEYDVDRETAQADVQEFLSKLNHIGIVDTTETEVSL